METSEQSAAARAPGTAPGGGVSTRRSGASTRLGILLGITAAVLFGLSAPLVKPLLPFAGPLTMAGLLYLGSGLGLSLLRMTVPRLLGSGPEPSARVERTEARVRRTDVPLLLGAVFAGGIAGPVLMLVGLARLSAMSGSLLLNLEAPFTILLAVVLLREHLGRAAGGAAALIVAGAVVLAWQPGGMRLDLLGSAAIALACLSWGVDNNLTQKLSLRDPVQLTILKSLGAGSCTLAVGLLAGEAFPPARMAGTALGIGLVSYGASLVCHIHALRRLGAARQAALFATAPFVGAIAAVPLLGDRFTPAHVASAALMACGVALLVHEHHEHLHVHDEFEHEHAHEHDEHHRHEHPGGEPAGRHTHPHRHVSLTHTHPHAPDSHHRHRHKHR